MKRSISTCLAVLSALLLTPACYLAPAAILPPINISSSASRAGGQKGVFLPGCAGVPACCWRTSASGPHSRPALIAAFGAARCRLSLPSLSPPALPTFAAHLLRVASAVLAFAYDAGATWAAALGVGEGETLFLSRWRRSRQLLALPLAFYAATAASLPPRLPLWYVEGAWRQVGPAAAVRRGKHQPADWLAIFCSLRYIAVRGRAKITPCAL